MITEIKAELERFMELSKKSEYVSIGQVTNMLYSLLQEARIKRLPKNER